jgi:hypothetical protein
MSIKVVVKNNNVEKALSIFKRKVKDSNIRFESFTFLLNILRAFSTLLFFTTTFIDINTS